MIQKEGHMLIFMRMMMIMMTMKKGLVMMMILKEGSTA